MPHAPCHRRLAANWAGGKDHIVMTPARWRCEISEALGPGHLPVHSSPPTASAGLPLPQSHHLTEGPPTTCVTSLPARRLPSLSACGRHCRSTSNEASTPSPVGLLVWLAASIPSRSRRQAPAAQPGQTTPGTRRHHDSRPHFAEIQISQNPTGWAPQRSLAPRTCRRPLPVCLSPSQSPSHGAPAVPQCCRGSRYYCTAERPWLASQIFHCLPSTLPRLHNHARKPTRRYIAVISFIRDMASPAQPSIPAFRREAHLFPGPTSLTPCAPIYVPATITLALGRISR